MNKTIDPEIRLWQKVIIQAVMDMLTHDAHVKQWFDLRNDDFITVCQNAHFNPESIYEKTMQALSKGARLRVALGKARDYEKRRQYRRAWNAQYKAGKMGYNSNVIHLEKSNPAIGCY